MLKSWCRRTLLAAAAALIPLAGSLSLLPTTPSYSAIPPVSSYRYSRTPSGRIHTKYQDGNDGTPAIPLQWQLLLALNLQTTDTGSLNLCSNYLTQPDPPDDDSVISVETGFSLPTDFTLGGLNNCVLSWSTPPATAATIRFRATLAGQQPATSGDLQITVTAPTVSDTLAPPYPVGLTAVNNVGSVTLSWDASVDNYEADGDAPSGTDYYEVCVDGAGCEVVEATPTTAPQFTGTTIGSPLTPSSAQTGNNWQIISGGDIDGVDDQMRFVAAPVTGDFTFTYKIGAITNNGATFPKFGSMARASLADGVRQVTCHNQLGTTGQMRRRATDAGSMGGVASATHSVPLWYRHTRTGTTETCGTSTDGNTFAAFGTHVDTLDTTVYEGLFVVGAAGTASTGNFENVNLSTLPRVSYIYNTTTGGAFTVKACDVAGNCSSTGASVTGTPTVPVDSTPPTPGTASGSANGSQTSINWSGGTATDTNGIRGYIPSFCGTTATCAGSVDQAEQASNSITQSSLLSGTTYYARWKAVDPSGNVSAYSNIASATTAGSAPPSFTAPTISSVTALSQTSLRITHSAVAGADHYLLREATSVSGTYTILTQFDHSALTVDRTGLTTGQTRCYQVAATNADESTIGPWTTTGVCGTTQVSSNSISWHPGHYAWVHCSPSFDWRQATHVNCIKAAIDQIQNDPLVKGVAIRQKWIALEGNVAGDYSAGFAALDSILAYAASKGKRIALELHLQHFGGYGGNMYNFYPSYLVDSVGGSYGITVFNRPGAQTGLTPRMWQEPTMNRIIAMAQAYGARYGNNTGNNAYLEWYEPMGESAVTVVENGETSAGYTLAGLITQIKRLLPAARAAFPAKGLRWHANYLGSDAQMQDVINLCATLGCIIGGPDVNPRERIQANEIYAGMRGSPIKDYRAITPFVHEVQSPELCGYEGNFTPAELYQFALTGDSANNTITVTSPQGSYFVWYRNTGECWLDSPTNTQPDYVRRWTNPAQTLGILPFIRTNPTPALKTTCPTAYTQGCNTSSLYQPTPIVEIMELNVIPFLRKSNTAHNHTLARAA